MAKKVALVGVVTGDEGKGKVITSLVLLARRHFQEESIIAGRKPIMVERWQGGGNAGHTIVVDGIEYKLNLVPSGIVFAETYNLMGKKTFVDPRRAVREIKGLIKNKIPISKENFGIAANAHITLDYHVNDDQDAFKAQRHTSTGSGIKQTAVDKQGRVGVRFIEFLEPKTMEEILREKRFPHQFPTCLGSIEKLVESYAQEREFLKEFVVQEQLARRTHGTHFWLGEGAQGALLDVDAGLYPGITSSNPLDVPNRPDIIIGVLKLYNSSVGADRPFVPQIEPKLESQLREAWGEYGTKTGLPRDLGWTNIVDLRYTTEVGNVDYLAATCGDRLEVLAKLGEKVKLVVGYKINGNRYDGWDVSFHRRDVLYNAKPIFEEFEPWDKFTEADGQTLTPNAQKYVDRIQELVGKEIIILGTGPAEKDIIIRKDPFNL